MSAVIVLQQRNAIHLMTDGAAYMPDGTLTWITPKAWAVPNLQAVVATRGAGGAGALLAS